MKYVEADREFLTTYIYDEYKSVNGIRPRWIDFDNMPIEKLGKMADDLEKEIIESIRKDKIRAAKWNTKVWFHRLMVEEARRSPDGVVFDNPESDNDHYDTNFNYGSFNEFRSIIGAEMYYFNTPLTNNMIFL